MGPNGATIKTPASDIYKLNAIKKIGNNIIQIPDKIIIKAPINMVIMNKINVLFLTCNILYKIIFIFIYYIYIIIYKSRNFVEKFYYNFILNSSSYLNTFWP